MSGLQSFTNINLQLVFLNNLAFVVECAHIGNMFGEVSGCLDSISELLPSENCRCVCMFQIYTVSMYSMQRV